MQSQPFTIDPDIRVASTLPASFYRDEAMLALCRERAFARSWQLAGNVDQVKVPGQARPVTLLPGCLDEPLLVVRGTDDVERTFANVCTHRGNLLVEGACQTQSFRCRYHGRRFGLDGRCQSGPGFEESPGFPAERDHLRAVPSGSWGPLLFAGVDPAGSLETLLAPVRDRVGWLPMDRTLFDAATSRDYLVNANWALYCENYLEGFHIPFVHAGLAGALDIKDYAIELFARGSLQIGVAASGEESFEPPAGSPDHGRRIAAYYFWLFPNLMLNFYPWGLSANVVTPLGVARTRVSFLSYVLDASRRDAGAGGALDRVEREDEAIVEAVQRGVRSRFYRSGRYSPRHETGVHHFHRLLADALVAA